jgi:hydrogenase-4 component E
MSGAVGPLLVFVLLLNLFVLGTSRLRAAIYATALQGVVLGVLAVLVNPHPAWHDFVVAGGAIALKAVAIPSMLLRAMRSTSIRHDIEPFVGFVTSMVIGAVGTGASLLFADTLPLAGEHVDSLLVPASLSTAFVGFFVLVSRYKALTQVVGYLILENGIFIMGLCLLEAMPFLVEIGVLLDLFAGIFVMGIIIQNINRAFSSGEAPKLTALRE